MLLIPYFVDGIEEGFIKEEIEDTSDMPLGNINNQDTIEHIPTSPKQEVNDDIDSDNQDTHFGEDTVESFQASPKQEANEDIEPHNNISANLDLLGNDNFSDLVNLSVPRDSIISNDVLDILKEQQNNVLSKLISERFCPENQSTINNSVQLEYATIKDEIDVEFQTITESSDEIKSMQCYDQENNPLPSQNTVIQNKAPLNTNLAVPKNNLPDANDAISNVDHHLPTENPPPAESRDLLDLNEISSSDPQRDMTRPTSSKTSIVDKQGKQCKLSNLK